MVSSVQRSPDIVQASRNASQRPEVVQQQFADHMQREVERRDQQVVSSNKSEASALRKDKENKERRREEDNKGKLKDKEKKIAALNAAIKGSLIDIRI
jgi:hypothetical protein